MNKFDNLPVENFDVMLIDAEGRESDIVKGGTKKISENMPIIIMEIWSNQKRKFENIFTSKEDVKIQMQNLGYQLIKKINDDYIFFPNHLKK